MAITMFSIGRASDEMEHRIRNGHRIRYKLSQPLGDRGDGTPAKHHLEQFVLNTEGLLERIRCQRAYAVLDVHDPASGLAYTPPEQSASAVSLERSAASAATGTAPSAAHAGQRRSCAFQ